MSDPCLKLHWLLSAYNNPFPLLGFGTDIKSYHYETVDRVKKGMI